VRDVDVVQGRMTVILARHPVTLDRPGVRGGRRRVLVSTATTPITIETLPDEGLEPVPDAILRHIPYAWHVTDHVTDRYFGFCDGGIWCAVWLLQGMGDLPKTFLELLAGSHGRPALVHPTGALSDQRHPLLTEQGASDMLAGLHEDVTSSWLRMTPFRRPLGCDGLPEAKGSALATAEETADIQARVTRWAAANLRLSRGMLWVRSGSPAFDPNQELRFQTSLGVEFGEWDFSKLHRVRVRALPGMATPGSLDGYLAYRARAHPLGRAARDDLRRACEELLEACPVMGACDVAHRAFVNAACQFVHASASRTADMWASNEAAALTGSLDEAVGRLTRWAALGAAGLIERGEWAEAIADMERTVRLMVRSFPRARSLRGMELMLAYAEEVVLPTLGRHDGDETLLADLADALPPSRRSVPVAYNARTILGAPVTVHGSSQVGTIVDFSVTPDGRVAHVDVAFGGGVRSVAYADLAGERGKDGLSFVLAGSVIAREAA
jgi:hypothetical protein